MSGRVISTLRANVAHLLPKTIQPFDSQSYFLIQTGIGPDLPEPAAGRLQSALRRNVTLRPCGKVHADDTVRGTFPLRRTTSGIAGKEKAGASPCTGSGGGCP
jgi:hypothetical protein